MTKAVKTAGRLPECIPVIIKTNAGKPARRAIGVKRHCHKTLL